MLNQPAPELCSATVTAPPQFLAMFSAVAIDVINAQAISRSATRARAAIVCEDLAAKFRTVPALSLALFFEVLVVALRPSLKGGVPIGLVPATPVLDRPLTVVGVPLGGLGLDHLSVRLVVRPARLAPARFAPGAKPIRATGVAVEHVNRLGLVALGAAFCDRLRHSRNLVSGQAPDNGVTAPPGPLYWTPTFYPLPVT